MARYVTKDGDMLDWICWRHYGDRPGAVEAVLDANPGLADAGPTLPVGMVLTLPELGTSEAAQPVRLWD
ncbi:tail protein X [Desulfocurvus vexinensis]|uniref:tail protein X n=1 Tax=Desulfocurvus vexinensis TaxID=399548 RepID=UPI00048B0B0F|nr:tail protein X [Desulfocurvus vexinensis]